MRPSLLSSAIPVLGLVAMTTGGQAQQPAHPLTMPSRDVTVTYDVEPDGAPAPQQVRVLFSAHGRLMRIDAPDGQGSTIMDRDRRLMQVVIGAAKVYMDVPEREEQRSPFLLDPTMQYTATGTADVAGLPCTTWSITTASGSAHACVTPDGVVLSEDGVDSQGARGHLIARSVSYGPIAAAAFQPPPGFTRVAHPEGPASYERGGAPGPGNAGPSDAGPGDAGSGAPAMGDPAHP
ncbi:DUF4412 domain-containing protein [Lichenicoccus sp.]|uniref:DUF4412 domain-containing protein n=1 Tax=Lichenicoccus sp. TaxID=2781899 RepID=UPI003D0D9177